MCAYVLMKLLESSPSRYDAGMEILTLGKDRVIKEMIATEMIRPGYRVLDLGSGTGTLAILCAKRGAEVVAMDISRDMLRLARSRASRNGVESSITWLELGVLELDSRLRDGSFDAVAATFFFSELSREERMDALEVAWRKLKDGGVLIVLDEARPQSRLARSLATMIRIPLLVIAWLVAQARTRPVSGIESMLGRAGFKIASQHRYLMGSLQLIVAVKEVDR